MSDSNVLEMLQSGREDMDWFNSNLTQLIGNFNNSFVAIHDKNIVDSDKNLDVLMKRLKVKKIDTSTVFIEFVSNVKSIL